MSDIKFWGRTKPDPTYWPFSNFYPAAFKVNGVWYSTSEHYYQAMKFLDPKWHEHIRSQPTPRLAANEGRRTDLPIREDWEDVKINIMYDALVYKFTSRPDLRALLLSTGEANIIEDSPYDYIWGCGKDGTGKNHLGRLLMLVRHNFRR